MKDGKLNSSWWDENLCFRLHRCERIILNQNKIKMEWLNLATYTGAKCLYFSVYLAYI